MAPAGITGLGGAPSGVGTRSRQAASTRASHKATSQADNGVRLLSKTAISHVLTPLRSFSHPSLPRARYPPHEPAQPLVVRQSAPGLPERPRPRISL